MIRILLLAVVWATCSPPAAAQTRVTINIGDANYYGRIDIRGLPPPPVLYIEPVIVLRAPSNVVRQPLYLRVPTGHAKDWNKHCRKYAACGHPVYFVEDRWYSDTYAPAYADKHGKKSQAKKDKRKGHDDD